jgi:hypothetical protein
VRTITVPERYSLPVTVQFTTELDDGLVINGTRISTFGVIPPAFCMDERTFEAAVYNDDSVFWSVDGEFCFTEGCDAYFCTLDNGCEGPDFSLRPGEARYPTLAACQEQCEYFGVLCDPYQGCQEGIDYGPPGSRPMGPATCEECVPNFICDSSAGCLFSGYYDINNLPPGSHTSIEACEAACVPTFICDYWAGCVFSGYYNINNLPPGSHTSIEACAAACVAYCVPEADCSFFIYAPSPEICDGFYFSCVPCDECNPLP